VYAIFEYSVHYSVTKQNDKYYIDSTSVSEIIVIFSNLVLTQTANTGVVSYGALGHVPPPRLPTV